MSDTHPHTDADTDTPKYVTVYEQTLNYGGGEEGGWWYTHLSPILSVEIGVDLDIDATIELAKSAARELHGRIFKGDTVKRSDGTDRPARSHSSASPEVDAIALTERTLHEHSDDNSPRPHYE